jgi:hypothetical protein
VDKEFTANDLEVGYEDSTAAHITLNKNSIEVSGDGASANGTVLTIKNKGTYVISGSLDNGQIIVDAGEQDKVRLVLNGVTINCSDYAPIYIKSADKVFITLQKDTQNTLSDGTAYAQTDENKVDGVIFSKADLTINGEGTLNITANYKHSIVSKDDLVFTGGTYNIKAVKNVLSGKNCVKIKDGTFNLSSTGGKGITSKNGDDTTKGYVYISGGTITITDCKEGIEGTAIVVDNGTIDITASDDGFNSASAAASTSSDSSVDATSSASVTDNKNGDRMGPGGFGGGGGAFENDTSCYLDINGGTIRVNANGDGLDSNGSLYITGGEIYVSGPTENNNGGLDYNGTADITGGTVVVAGSTGMAQGFSDTSTQYSILNNFDTTIGAGTAVTLTDKEGNVVVSYKPDKLYQSVVISTPKLTKGETYTLTCGSQTAELTLDSVVTSNGQQGMSFPGMGGQGHGRGPNQGFQPGQGTQPGQDTQPNQNTQP